MAKERPRYRVPDELRETLLDFTIAYLLERPVSVVEFGADFFQRLKTGRGGGGTVGPPIGQGGGHRSGTRFQDQGGNATEERLGSVDATAAPIQVNQDGRRKSVFAEAYNPEDDGDDEQHTVHPKSDEQRAQLTEAIKHILLFRSLDPEQVKDVLDAMFERKVNAGEVVIKQGDDGDNFYLIASGKYKVVVQKEGEAPKQVAAYDGTGSFGELALMYNMPRAASVEAETSGSLWAMDRVTFRRIVQKNAYKKRQTYETLLDAVPMLKALEKYERLNLADALVSKNFKDGETIIKQGDTADGMYFVEEGEAKVVRTDKGEEKEINRITKQGYFGELALLTKKPRAASVFAAGNIKLAFLDVEAFERLLGPCMEVMKRNVDEYEQQLVTIFGSKSAITDIR